MAPTPTIQPPIEFVADEIFWIKSPPKVEPAKVLTPIRKIPGKARNQPCECGSGVKAKRCECPRLSVAQKIAMIDKRMADRRNLMRSAIPYL